MLEIPLSGGLVAIADEADRDILSGYSWWAVDCGGRTYAACRLRGARWRERAYMHRMITAAPVGSVVHHINNDGLDNRRENLSVGTAAENLAAHHHQFRSCVYVLEGRFRAQARIAGRRVSLGMYEDRQKAHAAVAAARRLLFTVPDIDLPDLSARIKYEAKMGNL